MVHLVTLGKTNSIVVPSEKESIFFEDISQILSEGRNKIYVAVNFTNCVMRQQRFSYFSKGMI